MTQTEDQTLDASVIICTLDRSAALRQTLGALSAMNVPRDVRFEVVIIDNGSIDDTRAVIEEASAMLPIRHLYEGQRGAGRARNVGLASARGRTIFVTDDDCLVSSDWLESGLSLLKYDPRKMIGGKVVLHDPRDLPITIKTDTEPATLTSVVELGGFLHGCNMIFGRCVVDEIGPFDPLLGAGTRCKAAEDTDLVYRAFKVGIPVLYCPELLVEHSHGRRDPEVGYRLEKGYMMSFGAMAIKHLLLGRLDLIKVLYWRIRSDSSKNRQSKLPDYLAGCFLYLQSRFFQKRTQIKAPL